MYFTILLQVKCKYERHLIILLPITLVIKKNKLTARDSSISISKAPSTSGICCLPFIGNR